MRTLAAAVGVLLTLAVGIADASACSCARSHPAMRLPLADGALVGVVESRTAGPGGSLAYDIRVERAIKGTPGERVTVSSAPTSCQVSLEPGTRVGLFLHGASGGWSATTCDVTDPDALLAAGDLPAPRGTTRFVAAVRSPATDAVGLTVGGAPSAYAQPEGRPLALAGCGPLAVTAARDPRGAMRVTARTPGRLDFAYSTEIPLRDVTALGCTGRTVWAAGGGRLVSVRAGRAELVRRPGGTVAAIAGERAYFATRGALRIVDLAANTVRTVRHAGQFATLSVDGGRVAGRLTGGGAAVLDTRTRRVTTRRDTGALAWLDRTHLLDARRGVVLDARLRTVRRVHGTRGTVVGAAGGAAYIADGAVVRRLARGANRARVFARLPGPVVALTPTPATARAAWHSCYESANSPLTS